MRFIALLALFIAAPALAAFSQGSLNYTRDVIVQYSETQYGSSEQLCKTFRSNCVKVAGAKGQHHQLDCVYSKQAGPKLHAFCGGIAKDSTGQWTNGSPVTDFTAETVAITKGTKIIGPALGKAGCVKFAKKHPGIVC